jgi:ubiquinone/menaquinone biosynthesis C-methylase UbiE
MSSAPSSPSERRLPDWLWDYIGQDGPWEGDRDIGGQPFVVRDGIPRSKALVSDAQAQTEETFGFKWKQIDSFDSPSSLARMREWLLERYGDVATSDWLDEHGERPLLLDAGCGASMSALELLPAVLPRLRYLGVDVSEAVDVARQRFEARGFNDAAFVQADICNLPFADESVDLIFSEGVLHHTDSTQGAIAALTRLLKPGGRFLFYVYAKKGPIREFTDDYIRAKLQQMAPEDAWKAMEPLTRLGIALGELQAEIDIPEPIELLSIPAGRIDVQRLFYWHVAKMFYRPEASFDEMNHINYDWYAPANAARQTPEEVRAWCDDLGLEIERESIQEAGITIIARKRG